jgi:hypothetical protein
LKLIPLAFGFVMLALRYRNLQHTLCLCHSSTSSIVPLICGWVVVEREMNF